MKNTIKVPQNILKKRKNFIIYSSGSYDLDYKEEKRSSFQGFEE